VNWWQEDQCRSLTLVKDLQRSAEVIGGFAVVDVHSREEALEWAAKIAVACRCAQEVRELLPDSIV
jgi:hypothetical protein